MKEPNSELSTSTSGNTGGSPTKEPLRAKTAARKRVHIITFG